MRITTSLTACAVLLAAMALGACGKGPPTETRTKSSSSAAAPPAPATPDVTALLDGLKPGDAVGEFKVTLVGAVRADGAIPVELEKDGKVAKIAVTLMTQKPLPPASTEKYAVYYEAAFGPKSAGSEAAAQVADLIANRIRKVEQKVAAPAGIKVMAAPSQPI